MCSQFFLTFATAIMSGHTISTWMHNLLLSHAWTAVVTDKCPAMHNLQCTLVLFKHLLQDNRLEASTIVSL